MRPKLAHSPSREKLLEQAQELMLVKGFVATTVDEICKAAGLTKGTFFHYFKSKEELGKATLDHFFRAQARMVSRGAFRKSSDPLNRVYGWIDSAIELSKHPAIGKGCLIGNFAQELSGTHPELRAQCAQHFADSIESLKKDLDDAKAKYLPRRRLDTQGLAEHFIAVLQGSLILAKAKQDTGMVEKHLTHFKEYLRSVFGK
jgi:TetR/AcrR family transcriptional repressor of nem operon